MTASAVLTLFGSLLVRKVISVEPPSPAPSPSLEPSEPALHALRASEPAASAARASALRPEVVDLMVDLLVSAANFHRRR